MQHADVICFQKFVFKKGKSINRLRGTVSQYSRRKNGADSRIRKIRGPARVRLWHAREGKGGGVAWREDEIGWDARRHIKRRSFKGAILFSPKRKGYHRRGRICLITGGEAELEPRASEAALLSSISLHPSFHQRRRSTFHLFSSSPVEMVKQR